jgi:histidinol phosphatase-like enzyme
MLLAAARDLAIDLDRSAIIGDAERDMEAGRAAGVRALRVGPDGMGLVEAVIQAINLGETSAVLHRHE